MSREELDRRRTKKGMIETHRKEVATALLARLASRFGPVPPAVVTRVKAADIKLPSRWTTLAVNAATLEDVLEGKRYPY